MKAADGEIRLRFGRTMLWLWVGTCLPGLVLIEGVLLAARGPIIIGAFVFFGTFAVAAMSAVMFQYAYRFRVTPDGLARSLEHLVPLADRMEQNAAWNEITRVRSLIILPLCWVCRRGHRGGFFLIPHPRVMANLEIFGEAIRQFAPPDSPIAAWWTRFAPEAG